MIGTLFLLFGIHKRQRDNEREKRLQYWREQVKRIFSYTTGKQLVLTNITIYQNSFRQNILQMHETAQASIFQSREFIPSFGAIRHHNGRLSRPNIAI
jgi:hypothetical protein